jgi:hypothetical protein
MIASGCHGVRHAAGMAAVEAAAPVLEHGRGRVDGAMAIGECLQGQQ